MGKSVLISLEYFKEKRVKSLLLIVNLITQSENKLIVIQNCYRCIETIAILIFIWLH